MARRPHDIIAHMRVSEFKLKLRNYVHLRNYTLDKEWTPLFPPAMA